MANETVGSQPAATVRLEHVRLAAQMFMAVALVLLTWLVFSRLPPLSPPLGCFLFLAPLVVIAATCGFAATLASTVLLGVFGLVDGSVHHAIGQALSGPDGTPAVVVALGALGLAFYSDRTLTIAPPPGQPTGPGDLASRLRGLLGPALTHALACGAATLLIMACVLLTVQLASSDHFGAGQVILVFASAAGIGSVLGARFGMAAGLLGVLILAADAGFPNGVLDLAGACALVITGWWIGREADRYALERAILRMTTDAGGQIAAATTGADAYAALFHALTQVNPHGTLRIADERAEVLHERTAPGGRAAPAWRDRRLSAHGREFGVVYWTTGASGVGEQDVDGAVVTLTEVAASTILRVRLADERDSIESQARTEHVRTLMLDAVSHHFKTPLAGILGSVTSILTLPEAHSREAQRDLLNIIKYQANRLNRYIDKFLAVARLESGSVVPRPKPVQAEAAIYDAWEPLSELGGASRFLRVGVGSEYLMVDENLLMQILGNVLENAIKYSPEESLIDVTSRVTSGKMTIEITDQGPGIPADRAEQIFERFYRAKGTTAPGLGLGLYITSSLCKILGGSVSARNRADQGGAVFSITLPLAKAS
ncbi:MAG: hypothetical protein BGN86_13460 [Caulobacterales bacterium 68-7]|nr:MAG: hypothetical protein BGN86_13460 [Caulobacterales bacterium 68-7]